MTEIILAKINSKFNGYSNKIQAQTFSATGLIDLAFKSDS